MSRSQPCLSRVAHALTLSSLPLMTLSSLLHHDTMANLSSLCRIFEWAINTALVVRSVVVPSVTSTWGPTSSRVKRLLSSLSQSRLSILNSNMRLVSTSPSPVVSAFLSFAGSVPSVTTMPWCLTFSDPVWRISSTSATANSP